MAVLNTKQELRILDMDDFRRLVAALGAWGDGVSKRDNLTPAETELFEAAVDLEKAVKA